MIKKEIYIIRHGETDWNTLGKVQGFVEDTELNKNGIEQAKLTGKYLKDYRTKDKPFDWIICSPMKRAKATCNIIADVLNYSGEVEQLDILTEVKVGEISGTTSEDKIRKKVDEFEENYFKKHSDPITRYAIDETKLLNDKIGFHMETFKELRTRTQKIINLIKKSDKEKIIIVSHSMLINHLLRNMFKINFVMVGDQTNGSNCRIAYVTYNTEKKRFKLVSPYNTLHLGLYK